MISKPLFHQFLIALLFFAALAPTLSWFDFGGSMEAFNVCTAVGSLRTGRIMLPWMDGHPRLEKPPLTPWITEVGIASTSNLEFEARWPTLVMACGTLVAVYQLGQLLGGWKFGLVGSLVCASSLLFMKYADLASYDPQLGTWVALTNLLLARALFKGEKWLVCVGGGVALGLALMTKGPIALIETVVPVICLLPFLRSANKPASMPKAAEKPSHLDAETASALSEPLNADIKTGWALPIAVGILVIVAITIPWPLYAMHATGKTWRLWWREVTLAENAAGPLPFSLHTYVIFFPLMFPWLVWFLTGAVRIYRRRPIAQNPKLWLLGSWLVVPILFLEFLPVRTERYLVPMAGSAALIAAYGLLCDLPQWNRWTGPRAWLTTLFIFGLAIACLGLPLAGATVLKTIHNTPWYSPRFAAGASVFFLVALIVILWLYRRDRLGLVAGTAAIMLIFFATFMWGYKDSSRGRNRGRLMAEVILARYPDAETYLAFELPGEIVRLQLDTYLPQDVRTSTQPMSIEPDGRPQALVCFLRANGVPPAVPARFQQVMVQEDQSDTFLVYVAPPVKELSH